MKYFIDTEFIEGKQRLRKTWLEALTATKKFTEPTIDLISIGIVAEDGREYYAISKDFNLTEAWFRYDIKTMTNLPGDSDTNKMKVYWLRDNVLKPIWGDYGLDNYKNSKFTYSNFKIFLKAFGKSRKTIAKEIIEFCKPIVIKEEPYDLQVNKAVFNMVKKTVDTGVDFYGYYSSYDWVAFCWLFGNMKDLPSDFPMYCRDLKQELDRISDGWENSYLKERGREPNYKSHPNYPRQTNEHNALADARWNFELYKFLKQL